MPNHFVLKNPLNNDDRPMLFVYRLQHQSNLSSDRELQSDWQKYYFWKQMHVMQPCICCIMDY